MSGLNGKIIISTCGGEKAEKMKFLLESKGALVYNFPMIDIRHSSENKDIIVSILQDLSNFEWVIFTSTNGVKYFFYWLDKLEITKNFKFKTAAIGNATAEELQKRGVGVDYLSHSKDSIEFSNELLDMLSAKRSQILIPTGNLSPLITERILSEFHHCQSLIVYNTDVLSSDNPNLKSKILQNQYDLILFLSPSAVDGFMNIFPQHQSLRAIPIGKTTNEALKNFGIDSIFVPTIPNIETMITEIDNFYK